MSNKIFLDAAVLISAALSSTGASRELLVLSQQGVVELITNRNAIIETERNLSRKSENGLTVFRALMATSIITVVDSPSEEAVEKAAEYTVAKDAPIVAGAIETESTYLATFDRKHLINPPEVAEKSGLMIDTAGNVLQAVREKLDLQ